MKKQAQWYAETMGETAVDKFWNAMIAAGELLSSHPYLGKIEPILQDSSKEYRALIKHRDYKIIYYIEDDSHIVIVAI